ncbi:NeuD/PglB/VioB family sugar acetyltransferase [Microbacterium sp. 179-B 1A2 NHS]|uniref:NeuD/PglB/VioB family sugar acetyltransferase n=1 Tax=Microbacterium sp. 179-B 1A2 NHS TaxID=3142383 RepID=UPI0039A0EE6C
MTGGLLLLGAGGLTREVLASGISGVVGVLDDDEARRGTEVAGIPVLGPIATAIGRDEQLLVCIGPSRIRRGVVRALDAAGVPAERHATYIAPSARVGAGCVVAPGSILLDGVVVTADAMIGRHVVAMPNCVVTHDDVLADFVTLAAGVALGGRVLIGEAAYVGMNASVRPDCSIGREATVGMGAVVLVDVPAEETWAGVPARPLGVFA